MSTLDPRLLLRGYASGIFPMADSRDANDIFWVEPRTRAILPLHQFRASRSLLRTIRRDRFIVTRDEAFEEVIHACAMREETWINTDIERATLGLHAAGHAHSIECWTEGEDGKRELAGGLYGVRLGRAFFGESMFTRVTDASKVALAWLVARLRVGHFVLLDCQFITEHLASMGAVTVPRDLYASLLSSALGSADPSASPGSAEGESWPELGSAAPSSLPPPEFDALDRLLSDADSDGKAPTSGQLIAQLLGQTS